MPGETICIPMLDARQCHAYVARPSQATGPVPAIVVIQEIFGINHFVRGIADWLAEEGYLAVAPDLFHRLEPDVELTDQTQEGWARAFQLFEKFDQAQGVKDLIDTVRAARQLEGCNGKVGTVGFCLGGLMAYLMSTRSDADANVGYYGVGIQDHLNESVEKPLCLHIAGKDKFTPKEAEQQIVATLKNNPRVTIYLYDNDDHAFARVGGEHYDKQAAELAHQRTLEFFRGKLG